ncbi:MAG: hypothetical protein PHG03_03930, partial [Bacilli bacterium]|nr:hypothetical protein [Bacilli bacterium]
EIFIKEFAMENYKKLQELIKVYEETKMWERIDGDDIFKLSGFDKNVYVSIMGNAGVEYGIGIYYGDEDLLSQLDVVCGEYFRSPDSHLRLSLFKIPLGDPECMLSKADKKILKKNKIKPVNVAFRFDAGHLARIVTEEESLLLIDILNEILKVNDYIANNDIEFDLRFAEKMYSFSEKEGKMVVKKINYPNFKVKKMKQEKLDQDLVAKGNWITKKDNYHVFLVYAPMYLIGSNQYPYLLIFQNTDTFMIIGMEVIESNDMDKIANKLLGMFIKNRIIPKSIRVNSSEVKDVCSELIEEFKIKVSIDTEIEELSFIWQSLYDNE